MSKKYTQEWLQEQIDNSAIPFFGDNELPLDFVGLYLSGNMELYKRFKNGKTQFIEIKD